MEIFGMPETAISADGQHLSLTVETENGHAVIEINAETLRGLLPQLAALADRAKQPGVVSAMHPSRYFSRPTDDLKAVLVAFGLPNKLQFLFALDPTEAAKLQKEIGLAVQAGKSRGRPH